MRVSNHLIILSTIFIGFFLDNLINKYTSQFFIELNFGFLIFSYWVFALPEELKSFSALLYGLIIDIIFSEAIGFNMIFFITASYMIHLYVFRFRIFSYFQLSVFFSGSSIFYIACKYLLFSPINYSYILLIVSFFINACSWLFVYFCMRYFRRRFFRLI